MAAMVTPKAAAIALLILAFGGWVLMLTGIAYQQNKVGRDATNFPVQGAVGTNWARLASTGTNTSSPSQVVLKTIFYLDGGWNNGESKVPGYATLNLLTKFRTLYSLGSTIVQNNGPSALYDAGVALAESLSSSSTGAEVTAAVQAYMVALNDSLPAIQSWETQLKRNSTPVFNSDIFESLAPSSSSDSASSPSSSSSSASSSSDYVSSSSSSSSSWASSDVGGPRNNPFVIRQFNTGKNNRTKGVAAYNPFSGLTMNPLLVPRYWWPNFAIYSSNSYAWWLVAFQFFMIVMIGFAIIKPEIKYGVTALLAVLTNSVFMYSSELFNSPAGIYAFTHGPYPKEKLIVPSKASLGQDGFAYFRGLGVMFAGLIIVDIADALIILVLPLIPTSAEAATAGGKEETI